MESAWRLRSARALATLTVVCGALFYLIGDAIKPGYASTSQFISELNATGTPWASHLGYLGFLPMGLLCAAFLVLAHPLARVRGASRLGWWLLWSQPAAWIGAVMYPCDPGCPIGSSPAQLIHDGLGVVTYMATAAAMVLVSLAPTHPAITQWSRIYLRCAGFMFFVIFFVMLAPEVAFIRGLLQRLADTALAGAWLLIAYRFIGNDDQ